MATKLPKISIVTPSLNQAQFLEATIQSVLSQNYLNLEYIIIDGGSKDGSVEIIQKYQDRLHYWCSEPDAGQYDAINRGFAHSSGEIMAWINSDDMYFPWTFRTVASIMYDLPEVEWLTTLTPGYWDYNGFCTGFITIPGYSKESFLDGCYVPWSQKGIGHIQQESTFWKRSLWEKSGTFIDTQYKLAGDFDLWARFFNYAELYGVQSPLGGFRRHINQRSQQKDLYISEAEESLNNLRYLLNWKPSPHKAFASKLKFQKIPKLKNVVNSAFGYWSKKISRENSDSSKAYWYIESYKFYYS